MSKLKSNSKIKLNIICLMIGIIITQLIRDIRISKDKKEITL